MGFAIYADLALIQGLQRQNVASHPNIEANADLAVCVNKGGRERTRRGRRMAYPWALLHPYYYLQWSFNGGVVGTDSVYRVSSAHYLDTGEYICRARNSRGQISNQTFVEVTVQGIHRAVLICVDCFY